MDKDAIAELIEEKNNALVRWISEQEDDKWTTGPKGKWTTGQHALHLLQSIKPLNSALSMPKFVLRYKFGKTNRGLRDYQTVINRYQERLKDVKGKTYGPSKNMEIPALTEKQYLLDRLQVESKKLQYKTRKISDKNLDSLILPHPLMGKMPIREIIMWTAHHIEHHTKTLKANY
ncbi:DinB family protein [Psychroserpens ponticola]|uniref:DinB family protein n=1 Tax=Psychroserpens ponticola TaxID=2932268 RepID=A0ABY7S258_9FLAO|nr:DinB family protein [Psychroserpens ponticola]WCO03006.1 DinB family protein [Psychroserpens ponticola]